MNKEVNEIFDEWKRFLSWCYETNDKTVEIHRDKLKYIMDYTTNLQQENKQYESDISKLMYENENNERLFKQLKDNWNKLKEYIVKKYYMFIPLNASTTCINKLMEKMQELEGDDK